ncbi:single-stranded DNA-binding protein [Knoellia subterranea]|uniref:Single-stranded DNA-binding protein n=1 Tax=Knoellia subterranea KCTC 19937 TaxID=1385521 RepID=A0A0A0JU57_9MICO|nr:single-stranded DNA-binding protein [Knoellia subterranea]KGN39206.1 single-stranded DNA-binding protein [Knoellia subterranea KCTC 19937]
MQESIITVQGRVASDPEMKVSNRAGTPFATFRVASTPRRQVQGAPGTYEDGETSWFSVYAWGRLGANVLKSIEKGQPVVVTGRLSSRENKQEDGTYRYSVSISANGVGHDLSWGQAAFEKVSRPSWGDGDRVDDAIDTMQAEAEAFADPERVDYETVDPETGEILSSTGPLAEESAA